MYRLWPSPFYNQVDDVDDNQSLSSATNARHSSENDVRGQKRQRRSIFFSGPDSDSDEDDDDRVVLPSSGSLSSHRPDNIFIKLAVVPATPYVASPLCRGACSLTPSFPRRSSSPCLTLAQAYVAMHEEPNAAYRSYMEDRSATMTADGIAYLGIYDGHGGIDASTFLQQHLLAAIQAHLQPGCDVHDALTAAYSATNAAFRATGSIQGSTATTVILQKGRLIAANVGDSPAFVVKRSGEVYSVIQEHKIEGDEAARIAAQGVPIYRSPTGPAYMGTPDGTRWLNMSRAFGDFVYPAISCEPHVCSLDVSDGRYLVMGSDGLTEKWSVTEAALYLTQMAAKHFSLADICKHMVKESLKRGSTDNISCMVVDLEAYFMHAEGDEVPPVGAPAGAESEAGFATGEPEMMVQEQQFALRANRMECMSGAAPEAADCSSFNYASGRDSDRQDHCRSPSGRACEKRRRGDRPGERSNEATAGLQQLLCEETAVVDGDPQLPCALHQEHSAHNSCLRQMCEREQQEAALALMEAAACAVRGIVSNGNRQDFMCASSRVAPDQEERDMEQRAERDEQEQQQPGVVAGSRLFCGEVQASKEVGSCSAISVTPAQEPSTSTKLRCAGKDAVVGAGAADGSARAGAAQAFGSAEENIECCGPEDESGKLQVPDVGLRATDELGFDDDAIASESIPAELLAVPNGMMPASVLEMDRVSNVEPPGWVAVA